jgi:DNA-binding MarR family transcriptional regulator
MTRPPRTPSHEELTSIAELRSALRRFSRETEAIALRHGLTGRRYDLLAMLHSDPERTRTVGALAGLLELSQSATTELVDRAFTAGLVTRTGSDADRRVTHVGATPHGTSCYYAAVNALRPERERLLSILEEIAEYSARLSST